MNTLTPPGRFPGGFIKREGRPSEKEILTSRLIDRPIRPLFPEGFLNETQIIAHGAVGRSRAGSRTRWPSSARRRRWRSPIFRSTTSWRGVRVGMVDGKYDRQPDLCRGRESKLNIVVAGTEDGIVMVEAGAQQVSEEEVLGAIEFGHDCCKKIAAGDPRDGRSWPASRSARSRRPRSTRRCYDADREAMLAPT